MQIINAVGLHYSKLNRQIREAIRNNKNRLKLININGQYYIGAGLKGGDVEIEVNGIPGNDMAIFMDGPTIIVNNDAQDGISNTMNSGKVVVKGNAGDVLGYSMRGGKVFIAGSVGYRVGIHMKQYKNNKPVIVIGGSAGDFLGEYMAGGMLVLLGNNVSPDREKVGSYLGTGMHGGVIFIKGKVPTHAISNGLVVSEVNEQDMSELEPILKEFSENTGVSKIMDESFVKITPGSSRPYGKMYTY